MRKREKNSIFAKQLTMQNLVEFKGGDQISANFRLNNCREVMLDSFLLTKKSKSQFCTNQPNHEKPPDTTLFNYLN